MEATVKKSLKRYNYYGVDVFADKFFLITDKQQLTKFVGKVSTLDDLLVLGGGSNLLLTKNVPLVLFVAITGRTIIEDTEETVLVELGAGEEWHDFVTWAVDHDYEGVENMALIPGTIGGAVVGNIAAYGQNLSDVFVSAEVFDVISGKFSTFTKEECRLQYRDSRFKHERQYIVASARFELKKQYEALETTYHERKGRYGSLEEVLQETAKPPYSIRDVYQAVITIRTRKLPNPAEEGTVGSFFINPTVSKEKFAELSQLVPELQSYPVEDLRYTQKNWQEIQANYVKVPAGRLLDELGWRGKWEGNVGVSAKHALCVISNRNATGKEIFEFTEKMKKTVLDAYGVELESEIRIV